MLSSQEARQDQFGVIMRARRVLQHLFTLRHSQISFVIDRTFSPTLINLVRRSSAREI